MYIIIIFHFTNTLRLDSITFTVPLSDCQSLGVLDSTPWKTSLVKPPNPVTASFSKLALFKSISTEATVKLLTSLCHAPSTAVLSCALHYSSHLSGLPASSVGSLQCVQNCAAHLLLKKRRKLTISPLCFSFFAGSQPHKEFSTR